MSLACFVVSPPPLPPPLPCCERAFAASGAEKGARLQGPSCIRRWRGSVLHSSSSGSSSITRRSNNRKRTQSKAWRARSRSELGADNSSNSAVFHLYRSPGVRGRGNGIRGSHMMALSHSMEEDHPEGDGAVEDNDEDDRVSREGGEGGAGVGETDAITRAKAAAAARENAGTQTVSQRVNEIFGKFVMEEEEDDDVYIDEEADIANLAELREESKRLVTTYLKKMGTGDMMGSPAATASDGGGDWDVNDPQQMAKQVAAAFLKMKEREKREAAGGTNESKPEGGDGGGQTPAWRRTLPRRRNKKLGNSGGGGGGGDSVGEGGNDMQEVQDSQVPYSGNDASLSGSIGGRRRRGATISGESWAEVMKTLQQEGMHGKEEEGATQNGWVKGSSTTSGAPTTQRKNAQTTTPKEQEDSGDDFERRKHQFSYEVGGEGEGQEGPRWGRAVEKVMAAGEVASTPEFFAAAEEEREDWLAVLQEMKARVKAGEE